MLARDEELDRDVAVKVLSDVLGEDPSYVARFRREARVVAQVSHPNLVRMFDHGGDAERPYIAMAYLGGGTLADRIRAGSASEVDPERLARQLLGALEAIHAAGVVHRDVKPSNVLLRRRGRRASHRFRNRAARRRDPVDRHRPGHRDAQVHGAGGPGRQPGDRTVRSVRVGVVVQEALAGREAPQIEALIDRLTTPEPHERPASATQALTLLDTYEDRATTATVPIEAAAGAGTRVVE